MAICELDHLAAELPKDTYALVGGCFDPLHDGHLDHFWSARHHGPLVCAVESNARLSLNRVPLLPELTRLKIINNLSSVEHCTISKTGIVPILEALRPVAYVKGPDWIGRVPDDQVAACQRLRIPIIHTHEKPRSSTALLDEYQRRLNAEKLAAFERWVQAQANAVPWQPVTDYSRETRREIEAPNADAIVAHLQPRTVLDYGCGFGYLTELLRERGCSVYGYDPKYYHEEPTGKCDAVICREVLEHVPVAEILSLVGRLVGLSSRFVYVTTRFTAKSHLLDFDTSDNLDPTHITMLNQDYLRSLFVMEGCRRRDDLERALDHRKLGRVLVYQVPS